MLNLTIVIPTLNPSEKIFGVVEGLRAVGYEHFIIVNDGSRDECAPIFAKLKNEYNCEILTHEVNLGKGRALKTAMQHFLADPKDDIGIVTLDDDGQHTVADTLRVGESLIQNPDKLILGVREFNSQNVPPKSKWGNKITAFFMKFICGVSVSDTQTGLRAIPLSAIPALIDVSGERFEYETNMLLETSKLKLGIKEVIIETVYIENHSATHFHPIRDSFMIYKQLFTFAGSAVISFIIDYGIFLLLTNLLPIKSKEALVFVCTYTARFFSSIFNFFTNKKIVFGDNGGTLSAALRYYTLCIIQTGLSACITSLLSNISAGNMLVVWKLIADCSLSFFSYRAQRAWVFAKKSNKTDSHINERD